jgi:hypothetical protein
MLGNNSQTSSPTNQNEETKLTTTPENIMPQSNVTETDFSSIASEMPTSEKTNNIVSSSNSAFSSSRKPTPSQSGASSPDKEWVNAESTNSTSTAVVNGSSNEKNKDLKVYTLTATFNESQTDLTIHYATNPTISISDASTPISTNELKTNEEVDDCNKTTPIITAKPTMTSVAKATFFSCPTLPQAFTNPTLSHAGWALMLTGVALAAFGSLCAVSFVASMTLGIGLPLALIGLGLAVYDSCRAKNNVGSSENRPYLEEYNNTGAGFRVPSYLGEGY